MRSTWNAAGLLVLVLCLDAFAQGVAAPPQSAEAERGGAPQEKEILYLVPTGSNPSAARAYLLGLCKWIGNTPLIRDRYSIIYVSSRLERPLDETRSELSEGTNLREPSQSAKTPAGGNPSAPPGPSQEDRNLEETIKTADTLMHGSNSLWDVRGKLSLCYSSRGDVNQEPASRSSKSTVVIAELVELGPHGAGLSFVKASTDAREQAKYDFVPLSETDYQGTFRLLAAGALRPEEMAVAQVGINTQIDEVYRCTPSAKAHCLMQGGSAKIVVTAADSPFLPASQVSIPSPAQWLRGATQESPDAGEVKLNPVSASSKKVEVHARFDRPGLYRVEIPLDTRISAFDTIHDTHRIEFEVQAQPLIVEASQLEVVTGFEGRYWGPSLLDLGLTPDPPNTLKSRVEALRIMPAAEVNALASRLRESLGKLSSPKKDAAFVASWRKSVGHVVDHDSLRHLLSMNTTVTVPGGFVIGRVHFEGEDRTAMREEVWCAQKAADVLADMPDDLASSTTWDGEAVWKSECASEVGAILKSVETKMEQFPRIGRLHLVYDKELPRSFRLVRALKDRDSAELAVSALELDTVRLWTQQQEEVRLSALVDGAGHTEPIPLSLRSYSSKAVIVLLEVGGLLEEEKFILEEANDHGASSQFKFHSRLGVEVPVLSGILAPGFFLNAEGVVRSFAEWTVFEPEYTLSLFPVTLLGRLLSFGEMGQLLMPGAWTLELRSGYSFSVRSRGLFFAGQGLVTPGGPFLLGMGYRFHPSAKAHGRQHIITVSTGLAW